MAVNSLKKIFHPEELIALPFFIAMVCLYLLMGMKLDLRLAFVTAIVWISILFFCGWFLLYFVKTLVQLQKGGELPRPKLTRALSVIRDWVPLLIVLVTYENLHNLVPYLGRYDKDAVLYKMDMFLFGAVHPTIYLQRFIAPWLTDWLGFCYLSFFFYLPILGIILYTKPNIRGWRVFALALTIAVFIGFLGYIFIPAVGPLYYLSDLYTRDLSGNTITAIRQNFISDLSIGRDVFPSLHVALSTLYLILAFKYSRIWFYIFLPFIICLWFSTLYLRYHYFVDILAGFILAFFAFFAAEKLYRWWYED